MSEPLLEVADLRVAYPRRGHTALLAVDGVSFELARGEVLALVGESGSGKSSVARALVRLVPASAGTITLRTRNWPDAIDVARARGAKLRAVRGAVQLVFQDPFASLNPRLVLRDALGEALEFAAQSRVFVAGERAARADELLDAVGLSRALGSRLPHQLSGGQAQRAAIARALAVEPELLVCDEVLSGLDASVQAQVLELLADLVATRGLALLFIAHDLAAARWLAERVAVMQQGRIVECGPTERVLTRPEHAYTRALVAAASL